MKIMLYRSPSSEAGSRLFKAVSRVVNGNRLDLFQNLIELRNRLMTPGRPGSVAVIMAESKSELAELTSWKELLSTSSLLLIVPDEDEATIRQACSLYPRYLSYADGDFSDVASVLAKMLNQ